MIASRTKDNKHNEKRIIIQLNLNCYSSKERKELSKETFQLHDIENDIIIDDFIIHNIFIPKEMELCYNQNIKNKLQLFLCDSYEKMQEVVKNDKELKIVVDELERLNNDKYFGGLYNVAEEQKIMEASAKESGYREGHNIGLQEGRDIGSLTKAKEIAINMINEKCDINLISKVTNLSVEEINKLGKEKLIS